MSSIKPKSQNPHLSAGQWAMVADLLDQCVDVARRDVSYSDVVAERAADWMMHLRDKATSRSIHKTVSENADTKGANV